MSDSMPEVIWAKETGGDVPMHVAGNFENKNFNNATKYIRADIYEEQVRVLKEALEDALNIVYENASGHGDLPRLEQLVVLNNDQ